MDFIHQVNDECLAQIFYKVDGKSLISCMQVCHRFNNLMSADHFWIGYARENQMADVLPPEKWRKAAAQKKFKVKDGAVVDTSSFSFDYKKIVLSGRGYSTFNPMEEVFEFFKRRKILYHTVECRRFSIEPQGDGVQFEEYGIGCDEDPSVPRCLALSYRTSKITVRIDLKKLGIDTWILDHVDGVEIDVTQKIGHRRDCGAMATIKIELTGKRSKETSMEIYYHQWEEAKWESLNPTDTLEGNSVVTIELGGKDTQFWAGYYGPKFGHMQVRVVLPDEPIVRAAYE